MIAHTAILLTEADHGRISDAVHDAELHSAGEIVTIMSERSDGYWDVALAWSALVAFTALTVLSLFPHFYLPLIDRILGRWEHEWTPQAVLVVAAMAAMAKFLSMLILQLWQPLKWLLVPRAIKAARVRARAVMCFKVGAERRTVGRTGVLIYVSLAEHRAEIVADAAIASKVSGEVWGEAMAALLAGLRAGRPDLASADPRHGRRPGAIRRWPGQSENHCRRAECRRTAGVRGECDVAWHRRVWGARDVHGRRRDDADRGLPRWAHGRADQHRRCRPSMAGRGAEPGGATAG